MNQKDIELMAFTLKRAKPATLEGLSLWERIVTAVARDFKTDDRKFDDVAFLRACGFDSWDK